MIVVGGAGLPEQVAQTLHDSGETVVIIEKDTDETVARTPGGLELIIGDATVPATLEAAGAHRADVVVACTRSDEDNLVISLLAKRRFGVGRVVARVNDPENSWLFNESWGVDALVSPSVSLVSMIQEQAQI